MTATSWALVWHSRRRRCARSKVWACSLGVPFLAGRPPSAAPKQMTVPEGPPTTCTVASELILKFDGADTTILQLAKLDPPPTFPAGEQGWRSLPGWSFGSDPTTRQPEARAASNSASC